MALRGLVQDGKEPVWLELREGGRKEAVGDKVRELKAGPVHRWPSRLL